MCCGIDHAKAGGADGAFVVPAEIGHSAYARPVLKHLAANFAWVQVLAIRRKLFPDLSEDCWLLYCDGFGSRTNRLALSIVDTFSSRTLRRAPDQFVSIPDWCEWDCRLRPFLLSPEVRSVYRESERVKELSAFAERRSGRNRLCDGRKRFFPRQAVCGGTTANPRPISPSDDPKRQVFEGPSNYCRHGGGLAASRRADPVVANR